MSLKGLRECRRCETRENGQLVLGQEDRRSPLRSLQTALEAGDGGRLIPRPAMARVGALDGVLNVQSAVRNPHTLQKSSTKERIGGVRRRPISHLGPAGSVTPCSR